MNTLLVGVCFLSFTELSNYSQKVILDGRKIESVRPIGESRQHSLILMESGNKFEVRERSYEVEEVIRNCTR